jgi:hypothetical protein
VRDSEKNKKYYLTYSLGAHDPKVFVHMFYRVELNTKLKRTFSETHDEVTPRIDACQPIPCAFVAVPVSNMASSIRAVVVDKLQTPESLHVRH